MKALLAIILIFILVALYLAPTIIGYLRRVRDLGSLTVINIAFGWTFIGWFIALAMAFRTATVPKSSALQHSDDNGETRL